MCSSTDTIVTEIGWLTGHYLWYLEMWLRYYCLSQLILNQ